MKTARTCDELKARLDELSGKAAAKKAAVSVLDTAAFFAKGVQALWLRGGLLPNPAGRKGTDQHRGWP